MSHDTVAAVKVYDIVVWFYTLSDIASTYRMKKVNEIKCIFNRFL